MPDSPIRDQRRFIAAARHAAQRAVNPSRLMEGENAESLDAADVRHWVTVYSELLAFKQRSLDHLYHDLEDVSRPANEEIRSIDVPLIEGEQARYRQRLLFWQARASPRTQTAPFYSPFQSDGPVTGRASEESPRPREQFAPQLEQAPVLAMHSGRRRDD
ncbi:MAG: hypothetical protein ABI401_15520 [Candidatus Dormibacter sp.]